MTSIVEDFLKKDQFQPIRPFGPLRAKPLCTHFAQGGSSAEVLTGFGTSDTAGNRAAGRPGSLSGDSRRRGPQGVWPVRPLSPRSAGSHPPASRRSEERRVGKE